MKFPRFSIKNVPFDRRYQTACTAALVVVPIALIALNILFLLTSYLWMVYLCYVLWIFFDRNVTPVKRVMLTCIGAQGYRQDQRMVEVFSILFSPHKALRSLQIFQGFRDYFPAKLIRTVPLNTSKPHIFGAHPHGIIGISIWANFANEYSVSVSNYSEMIFRRNSKSYFQG